MQEYAEHEHQRTREKREKALTDTKVKGEWTMSLVWGLDLISLMHWKRLEKYIIFVKQHSAL